MGLMMNVKELLAKQTEISRLQQELNDSFAVVIEIAKFLIPIIRETYLEIFPTDRWLSRPMLSRTLALLAEKRINIYPLFDDVDDLVFDCVINNDGMLVVKFSTDATCLHDTFNKWNMHFEFSDDIITSYGKYKFVEQWKRLFLENKRQMIKF